MILTPRDWQAIAQREAGELLGTHEGAAKLAEAKRFGLLADALVEQSREIGLLRGAIAADDERLHKAAERAGLPNFGCDTAEHLADEIERLRAQFEVAEAARFAAVSKAQWQAVTNRELNERADETARLHAALALAEAALADIGDADREPGDDLAWCEARAAQDLPAVRAALAGLGA